MTTSPELSEARLLPVRAVNAHVFCPRLFWLEYVEGEWSENHHTVHGKQAHRRVDQAGGSMPSPKEEPKESEIDDSPTWETRSLWLSDSSIGVTGKIDLVEQQSDGTVMPIDTKKGRAKGDSLWPPDAVQLTLQALLLRSQGYHVTHVAAWYVGSRKRVVVPLTADMELTARRAVMETRATRDATTPPGALVESKRCHGCSLQPVCLPDEMVALQCRSILPEDEGDDDCETIQLFEAANTKELRRIQPPSDLRLPLYVHEHGARIGISGGSLKIKPRKDMEEAGEKPRKVGLGQISQVNVMGGVQISSQALQACLRQELPVSFFSSGGWLYGQATATENRQIHTRLAQFSAYKSEQALEIARVLIADKIHNCRVLLRRNANGDKIEDVQQVLMRLKRLVAAAQSADSAASLLGVEGEAAKLYWGLYSQMISLERPIFVMKGRNRRPPRDPSNALLSYGYALLCKDCSLAVRGVGLDTHLGMFHTPHHGNPAMALDLMEPFRPLIVDSVVNQMIHRGEVGEGDFVFSGQSVGMKKSAKRAILSGYERRIEEHVTHPLFGYRISYRRILHVQARLLSRVFLGELEAMPSFRTR